MDFLLSDEKDISLEDYEIRKKLYSEFLNLPVNFVSKMRHLQPQVGCFNNCSFCSKFSVCKSEYWNRGGYFSQISERVRTIFVCLLSFGVLTLSAISSEKVET